MTKLLLAVYFLNALAILPLATPKPYPGDLDSENGIAQDPVPTSIQNLLNNGTEVSQLVDINTINSIENQPFDYEHAQTGCTTRSGPLTKNGIIDTNARWYKVGEAQYVVAAVISPDFTQDEIDIVHAAMIEIQENTCIRFYLYNSASDLGGNDFVEITKSDEGCYSEGIGRMRKGRQQMNLQPTDSQGLTCMMKGIAVHELLHVIGFFHQQNTPERDDYVNIIWDNIEDTPGARYQFVKIPADRATSFGAPYDYGSIMHYARKDFTRNGGDTIVAKQNGATFGQRERISYWDSWKVNRMHNCPT